MIVQMKSYPRVGLVGNPSDGYFGKTIAFLFKDFHAEVLLYETPELEILAEARDRSVFRSIAHLAQDVRTIGYYGGVRLLKAAIKRFYDYCQEKNIHLGDRNFTIRYHSDIPHQVGLDGSSAIVTAAFRALCFFYHITIPNPVLANFVLSVERDELDISAGLQDRVVQACGGMVYMDFAKEIMERDGCGRYEPMDMRQLPPLYVAYDTELAEGSELFHNNIRQRFARGEAQVVEAMSFWAELTDKVRDRLESGKGDELGALLNANFDKRSEIYRINPRHLAMVDAARGVGASAKFSGSGGAITGTYDDEPMYHRLEKALGAMNITVFKPTLY